MPTYLPVTLDWNRNDQIVFETLYMAVQYTYGMDVEGDVIEFGTMSGNSACALAQGIVDCESHYPWVRKKQLWLLDSFQGLPASGSAADLEAPHVRAGVWGPGTNVGLSETALAERLRSYSLGSRVQILNGWFRDTVLTIPQVIKYCCIHVDCDLYESTLDALTPLFARSQISKGAIILFDDWNCNRASNKYGERRAWHSQLQPKFFVQFSDEGSYGVSGHKFIVHDYEP
jgi:O-methyltransferase